MAYKGPDRGFGQHDDYAVGDEVWTYDNAPGVVVDVRPGSSMGTTYDVEGPDYLGENIRTRSYDGSRLALVKRAMVEHPSHESDECAVCGEEGCPEEECATYKLHAWANWSSHPIHQGSQGMIGFAVPEVELIAAEWIATRAARIAEHVKYAYEHEYECSELFQVVTLWEALREDWAKFIAAEEWGRVLAWMTGAEYAYFDDPGADAMDHAMDIMDACEELAGECGYYAASDSDQGDWRIYAPREG